MVIYEPGDVIVEEKPFVCVLNNSEKRNRCDFCFKAGQHLKRCSGCKKMFYCNPTCQLADWRRAHKLTECHVYQLSEKVDTPIPKGDDQPTKYEGRISDYDTARLLLRLYLTVHYKPHRLDKGRITPFGQTRSLADLMEHQEEVKKHKDRMQIFDQLNRMFERSGVKADQELLFRLFCKMYVNGFSIMSLMLAEVGRAVYLLASLFDHSCVPNAVTVFHGPDIEVRAVRRVDTTQEPVLLSYLNVMVNPQRRVKTLEDHYYFRCGCERCVYEKLAPEIAKAVVVKDPLDKAIETKVEVVKEAGKQADKQTDQKKTPVDKKQKNLKKSNKKRENLVKPSERNEISKKPNKDETKVKNEVKPEVVNKKNSEKEKQSKLETAKPEPERTSESSTTVPTKDEKKSRNDPKPVNQIEKPVDQSKPIDQGQPKEEKEQDWHELKKHKNRRFKKRLQNKQAEQETTRQIENPGEQQEWDPTPSAARLKSFAAKFDGLSKEDWQLLVNQEQLSKEFTDAVVHADWPSAIQLAEKQLRCYQQYYASDENPEITLHLVQSLQILRNLLRNEFTLRNENVRKLFHQLQRAVLITHGKSHDLYKNEYADICQYLNQEY